MLRKADVGVNWVRKCYVEEGAKIASEWAAFLASLTDPIWLGILHQTDKPLTHSLTSSDGFPDAYLAHSPPLTGTPFAGLAAILYWSYSPVRSLRPESRRILKPPKEELWWRCQRESLLLFIPSHKGYRGRTEKWEKKVREVEREGERPWVGSDLLASSPWCDILSPITSVKGGPW